MRFCTEELCVGYQNCQILRNLSLEIPIGKITAIIGANGCGKSTLLKAMTRILPTQSGAVVLDGKNIAHENTKELARRMAILPQTQEVASGLTVAELVFFGRFPYQKGFGRPSKRDLEVIDWALEVTGTLEYKHRTLDALSGGQRQRVWIAMALAQETEMIFLDEPTTYLDLTHQLEVLELLQRLNREQGRTIVMVLHDLNQAARFADHLIALKDGDVVRCGNCNEVICHDVLESVFSIDADLAVDPRTGRPVCVSYSLIRAAAREATEVASA